MCKAEACLTKLRLKTDTKAKKKKRGERRKKKEERNQPSFFLLPFHADFPRGSSSYFEKLCLQEKLLPGSIRGGENMEKAKSGWMVGGLLGAFVRSGGERVGPRLQGCSEKCPKGVDLDRVARYT